MYHEVRQKRIIQKPIGNLQKSIGISIISCVGYVQLEILVYQSFIDGTTHCKLYWGVYFFVKLNTVGPHPTFAYNSHPIAQLWVSM